MTALTTPIFWKLLDVLFVLLCLAITSATAQKSPPADVILFNGKIFTSDPAKPFVEAVSIRADKISSVGSTSDIKRLAGPATRSIDLGGRTVVPGFNDAHAHFGPIFQGIQLKLTPMEPTWTETSSAVEKTAASAPKGEWIFGTIGERIINDPLADRTALDRLAPNNPVFLTTFYGHGAIFNSAAMRVLKIRESAPDPAGGVFERIGSKGELTGRVYEYAQWRIDRMLAEQGSDEQFVVAMQKRLNEAASFGITSMQIMPGISTERFVRILQRAAPPIRVRAIAFSRTTENGRDPRDIRALSRLKPSNPNVTVSGIKWIIDGTPLEHGAAMRSPYRDRPDLKGRINFSESEIEDLVRESLELKQPLLMHAVGDGAVEAVFDAMERVGDGKIDWPSKRVRIEHGEGVSGDLIARAKKLGVVVVQNPSHFALVEALFARWGKDSKFSNQRSLIDAGIPYALGSDGPMNPFLNIMLATIDPARPTEVITREQAVRAYTSGSAFAEFAEAKKGTIAIGKLADLAVLSQDIFTVPTDALPATTSVLTMVGGKIIYDPKVLR